MWPPMLVTNVTSEQNVLLKTTIFEIVRHNKIQPINISLKYYLKNINFSLHLKQKNELDNKNWTQPGRQYSCIALHLVNKIDYQIFARFGQKFDNEKKEFGEMKMELKKLKEENARIKADLEATEADRMLYYNQYHQNGKELRALKAETKILKEENESLKQSSNVQELNSSISSPIWYRLYQSLIPNQMFRQIHLLSFQIVMIMRM